MSYLALSVPRTGLEPARLAALAPETSASTIPPPGPVLSLVSAKLGIIFEMCKFFEENLSFFVFVVFYC